MIILMHPKYFDLVNQSSEELREWCREARIPDMTKVVFEPTLPEEDEKGNPIFAFSVNAGELHYWTGKPIYFPDPNSNS